MKFDEKEKKNQKVTILRAEIMNLDYSDCWTFFSQAKHEWLPLPVGQGAARNSRKSSPQGDLSENHVSEGRCLDGSS